MQNKRFSGRELIASLLMCRDRLLKLSSKKGKRYSVVLGVLTKYNYLKEEDIEYPSVKLIQKETALSYQKVRKHLLEIYDEALALRASSDKTTIYFLAQGFYNSYEAEYSNLKYLPSVGEEVNLPFLRYKLGTTSFYVDRIIHEIYNGEHQILIWLFLGNYNQYWALKKAEGFFKGHIGWSEYYEKRDYELQDRWKEWKW